MIYLMPVVGLHEIYIALARFIWRRLSFTLGDSVAAFWVKLGTNDLNCVDVPLNPTHSLTISDAGVLHNSHSSVSLSVAGIADGLCYRLTKACPKVQPTRYELAYSMKDQYEVSRDSLEKKELLGSGNFGEVWRGVYVQIRLAI